MKLKDTGRTILYAHNLREAQAQDDDRFRGPASNGPIKQANRRSINFRPVVCELHGNEGIK